MNENRPAWERKVDREYIWKKVMAVLVILGIAVMLLLLLYHIPLVTDYNKTFTGYELHYDPETDPTYENPATVKGSKVRFEGKLYRYLFRTDYFDGLVYFDDFTTLPNSKYVISDTTQIFYSANDVWLSAVVNPLWGPEIKRGKNERICWAFVNFDRKNEIFAFNISIGDEADNSWSLSDNYIVVPAETPEEAAEMYHERIWQMMQDDIAKAEKEQAIEPVKTIEGNLKTYYEMSDGTWQFEGQTYKYRLVISGRQPFAVKDTTYVYLSNIEDIPFGKAMMASVSSNTKDYFTREEAVLVEIK